VSIDDQTLMAFADGELQGEARDAVAAAVAADPVLARRLERFGAVRALLADPLKAAAPPPRDDLLEAARASVAREAATRRMTFQALAAGVAVVVVALGVTLLGRGDGLGHLQPEAPLGGALRMALDDTASGASSGTVMTKVQPLYTVVAADGRRCRAFRAVRGSAAYEGAACRSDGAWRLVVLAPIAKPAGGFTQASGDEPPAVTAAIDALRPGDPLEPAAERALIAAGWRPARE